jgi:Lysyl oxidase/S-layer homology domain
VTTRVRGRGTVRRLALGASLAALAATSGVFAGTVGADDRLPNMRADRPTEIHIVNVNGHRLLKFTAVMVNVGAGPMEVLGRRSSSIDPWTVNQVVYDDAGGSRRVVTGAHLAYAGDGHDHWHVRKMMAYHLFSNNTTRGDSKVGFCFFDTNLRYPNLPSSPSVRYYRESWCGTRTATTSRTGISVGWADKYSWKIAFQWIDITGLPGGEYVVRAIVDPYDWFLETDDADNCGYRRVRFGSSGTSVSLVGSGDRCITDWEAHPLAPHIAWVFEARITGGCDVLAYCPGASVTRAQMAMFIDRAMLLAPTDQDFFTDDEGVTGEGSINRLAAAGITGGCAPNRFCPSAPVSRGQMASFLVRALNLPPATTPNYFDDDDGSTHEASIDSLAEVGITGGCGERRFCPNSHVTRAQMAAFLHRAFGTTPPPEGP